MQIQKYFHRIGFRLLLTAALILPLLAFGVSNAVAAGASPRAVYTLTNSASGNEVVVFNRAADGTLAPAGTYATGGLGTGGGLGSQGALVLGENDRWLFAVNAGSDEISVFLVRPDSLILVDKVASGGDQPISLTVHGRLLYVLNAGDPGNITGFSVGYNGKLSSLASSMRPLSNGGVGAAPGPAQVSFSPDGDLLVVTEKATNLIDTYTIDEHGLADGPTTHASSGATPFGFEFSKRGHLIVSEAFGGAADQSALSSYEVDEDEFQVISPSIGTNQTAACWVVVTKNGKYAYTTNTGSGSISGYLVSEEGELSLLNADGRTGVTGDGSSPIDAALSHNSHYLYTLNAGAHNITAFRVQADGSLIAIGSVGGLPAGAVGLAAR